MSIDVPVDALGEVVAGRAPLAYLVTVGEPGPRVVSVTVAVDGDGSLTMAAGRHSWANVQARPAVTLLWPPDQGDPHHSLLVDGLATTVDDEVIRVRPSRAIRHRIRSGRGA